MLMSGGLTLFAAAVCLGYGLPALRLAERLRPGISAGITVGDVGILGYIVLSLVATLLNVMLPLSAVTAGSACLLGLGLLAFGAKRLAGQATAFGWTMLPTAAGLIALCFLLGRLIPASTASHYDTGLYHVQAIRLIMEHPLILGIANVHMRFGYNSSLFQTAALLSGGVSGMAGAITTNALLIAFVVLAVLQRVTAALHGCGRSAVFALLVCALAVFTPILPLRSWAGTPNTDIPSGMMVFYAFSLALHLSDLQRREDAADRRAATALLLLAVVALAVTLKLSAAPAVLLAILPLLAWRRAAIAGRDLTLGIGAALAIGLPWLARGIATSGCLAFPQPSSCLPVPWRINAAVAQSDIDWMRSWARRPEVPPEIVLADWSWLPGWLASLAREPALPTFVALALVAAVLVLARVLLRGVVTVSDGAPPAPAIDIWILAAIAATGMAFWFFSAPLVRYGQSWLVLPLLLAIAQCFPVGLRRGGRGLKRAAAMFGSWSKVAAAPPTPRADTPSKDAGRIALPEGGLPSAMRRWAAAGLATVLVLAAAGHAARQPWNRLADTGFPHYPDVAVQSRGVLAGSPIHVPVQGNQCWDAPRICTPNLKDGLVFAPFLWSWWVRDPS